MWPLVRSAVCLLVVGLPGSTWAADFGALRDWVGSYPVRERAGRREQILESRPLKSALAALLGSADVARLEAYGQSKPVEGVGDLIVITRCRPRNCAPERALLVLDTRSDRLWAGFFERTASKVSVRWYGNADSYTVLPPEVLNGFREER